jgi:UDP-N-acetylmuramoyl-tripeptide--D-alanyl-D-alanine ligase
VNNAQREHQEHMGTVEAVARENAACFQALPAHGTAVFPANDPYTALWHSLAGARPVLTFGDTPDAASGSACPDVHGRATWSQGAWALDAQTPVGPLCTELHIAGRHNVRNALAAAACAIAAGVSVAAVAEGLRQFVPVTGRSRAAALAVASRTVTLVDDSYNANPDSVRAAIDVLADLPGPRHLVLGDMGEVGDQGLAFHDEVLRHALACGVDRIDVTGDWMAQASAPLLPTSSGRLRHWTDFQDLVDHVAAALPHTGSVLVKGSRFMRMERLVQALERLSTPDLHTQEGAHHAA